MKAESTQKKDAKMWAGVWRTIKVTDEELDQIYYRRSEKRSKPNENKS